MIAAMILAVALATPASAEGVFVAGLRPDRRPEEAPRIGAVVHPRTWYERALTGIAPPYPHSLFFLDAQGDWYSPFVVAGMVGRYDIRGWHLPPAPRR
jgi:hypothetical protein